MVPITSAIQRETTKAEKSFEKSVPYDRIANSYLIPPLLVTIDLFFKFDGWEPHMTFPDRVEKMIEKAASILDAEKNVIRDEFTRFNTIYVGNIQADQVTFELQLTLPEIARVMKYDLNRFYQDRDFNFEKTLEYRLWHRDHIPDDSPFIGIYEMDYACHSLEYSMFGIMPQWVPGEYPSYGHPILREKEDLKSLKVPDFFTAGFMPKVIEDYNRIKQELNGRLEIGIRKSVQGPFQVATGLRGQENVFAEEIADPDFILELMEFAFEFHKSWVRGWEELHGRPYGMFNIGDDDIDTTFTVSPRVFRQLILPVYVRYGREFGSIHWHSCGDTNNIFQDIATIPNLQLLEMGPKDDSFAAAKIFAGTGVRFYKCPNPVDEVFLPVPGAQEAMIENVLRAGELVPIKILCEADNLEKGMVLLSKFREVAGQGDSPEKSSLP